MSSLTDQNKLMQQTVQLYMIKIKKKHLLKEISIFNAEIWAIDLPLNLILKNNITKYIIFSHSLSVITVIENKKIDNPSTNQIKWRAFRVVGAGPDHGYTNVNIKPLVSWDSSKYLF